MDCTVCAAYFAEAKVNSEDLMGICSAGLAVEEKKANPDPDRLAAIEIEVDGLWRERAALGLTDDDRVAFICNEYGARVRAHRAQSRPEAA